MSRIIGITLARLAATTVTAPKGRLRLPRPTPSVRLASDVKPKLRESEWFWP